MSNEVCETMKLENGELKFSANVAGSGPTVVLLHGFPDTRDTYRQQLEALSGAGYRVVVPAMRGYEPCSLARDGNYGLAALAGDVLAWIDQLEVEKVHLVGHDWGSAIAQTCAAMAPEKLHSLTLISVPQTIRWESAATRSLRQIRNSWYMLFFQIPLLPQWIIRRKNYSFLSFLWRSWSPDWEWPEASLQSVKDAFSSPGVIEAALAYYRQNLNRFTKANKHVRQTIASGIHVPTLGIIGARDGCIDCKLFCESMRDGDFPAGVSVHVIPEVGHFPQQEAPVEVNVALLDFFARIQ